MELLLRYMLSVNAHVIAAQSETRAMFVTISGRRRTRAKRQRRHCDVDVSTRACALTGDTSATHRSRVAHVVPSARCARLSDSKIHAHAAHTCRFHCATLRAHSAPTSRLDLVSVRTHSNDANLERASKRARRCAPRSTARARASYKSGSVPTTAAAFQLRRKCRRAVRSRYTARTCEDWRTRQHAPEAETLRRPLEASEI